MKQFFAFRSRSVWRNVLGGLAVVSVVSVVLLAVVYSASGAASSRHLADPQVSPLSGNVQFWSSVGSTGSVDEGDLDIYKVTGARVTIKSSASFPAKLDLRYSVTVNDNLIGASPGPFILLRYRDNGPRARIVARLRAYNRDTGETTTLITLDSNNFPQSDTHQDQFVLDNTVTFNFTTNSYFVEVTMTRNDARGKPSLGAVFVGKV